MTNEYLFNLTFQSFYLTVWSLILIPLITSEGTHDKTLNQAVENLEAERAIDILHLFDLEADPEERNDIK